MSFVFAIGHALECSKETIVTTGESAYDPGWLSRLIAEVGRAAQAGDAQTARLIALLAVTAAAIALVVRASR